MTRAQVRLGLTLALIAPTAACVGVRAEERAAFPNWFTARLEVVEDRPFPKLEDVPREVAPLRDAEAWSSIERELRTAGRALAADPRNVRADASEGLAVGEEAREAFDTPRAQSPTFD